MSEVKRTQQGRVVSDKMDKSITVAIERFGQAVVSSEELLGGAPPASGSERAQVLTHTGELADPLPDVTQEQWRMHVRTN